MNDLPFTEIQLSNDTYIREFVQSSEADEFRWHRDYEDRVIVSINKTDWLIQLENKLPQELNSKVLIERGEWHRLIKGTGKLKLKIVKC